MYQLNQKVRVVRGANKGKRGIISYVGTDGSWYNIATNKGAELKVIPFNVIEARPNLWQRSG